MSIQTFAQTGGVLWTGALFFQQPAVDRIGDLIANTEAAAATPANASTQ
jgi:hypothetical protein